MVTGLWTAIFVLIPTRGVPAAKKYDTLAGLARSFERSLLDWLWNSQIFLDVLFPFTLFSGLL